MTLVEGGSVQGLVFLNPSLPAQRLPVLSLGTFDPPLVIRCGRCQPRVESQEAPGNLRGLWWPVAGVRLVTLGVLSVRPEAGGVRELDPAASHAGACAEGPSL